MKDPAASLRRNLPAGYADVKADPLDVSAANSGIVIPVCGRAEYLRRCLDSLAASDLSDAIVVIVDETGADRRLNVPGFTALPGVDSRRGDIRLVQGSLDDVARVARRDPHCVAFNTLGWCKRWVRPRGWLTRKDHGNFQLFVKNRHLAWRPDLAALSGRVFPPACDSTRTLVESFRCGAPVIRLFKRRHGNMFCSLKRGWDLLVGLFGCRFLACLDSDAVVAPGWLRELETAWQTARALKSSGQALVTGFHTEAHPVLAGYDGIRLKASMGGINLFFSSEGYIPTIRPALEGIFWDHQAVHNARRDGWVLACTNPSVVQHIGIEGVWSQPDRLDRATDFSFDRGTG